MHFWVNGKIDNYQIVSATAGVLRSPTSNTGMRGALEKPCQRAVPVKSRQHSAAYPRL